MENIKEQIGIEMEMGNSSDPGIQKVEVIEKVLEKGTKLSK